MIFLDGTENGSKWREIVKKKLKPEYFDPTELDQSMESFQKRQEAINSCKYRVFVITPLMTGFHLISDAVDDSNKKPLRTIFCFLEEDEGRKFNDHQIKSLKAIGKMVKKNKGIWLSNLDELVSFLNDPNYNVPEETNRN